MKIKCKKSKRFLCEINYNETGHDLEYCWFNNNNYTSLPQSIKCDLYPSGFSTPYTICLGYLSTLFPNKDINTYIEIPSQFLNAFIQFV